MRKFIAALFSVGMIATLALGVVTAPAGADTSNGTVYVVHAIPGVTVDVYVNGKDTLPGFTPGTVAGPLSLPAGSYATVLLAELMKTDEPTPDTSISLPFSLPTGGDEGPDAQGDEDPAQNGRHSLAPDGDIIDDGLL